MRFTASVLALSLFTAAACGKKDPANERAGSSALGAAEAAAKAAPPAGAPLTLPAAIPATAAIVGALEAPEGWFESLGALGILSQASSKAMAADLQTYLRKTTGLELAGLRRAAWFVAGDGKAAVLVSQVGGELGLPLPPGVKMARTGDWLIVGHDAAVDVAIAAAEGRAPRLAADSPLAKIFASESRGAILAGALDLSLVPAEAQLAAKIYGVERAAFALGPVIRVVVQGDANGLTTLLTLFDAQVGMATAMLDAERKTALETASMVTGPSAEALGRIVGSYAAADVVALVRPKLEGDSLRLEVSLGANPLLMVAGIGVLSAVAIPAFIQYQERSRAAAAP